MERVKGTILVDFVKTIRADRSGACDALLTDQDREVLSSRILPSAWYPFSTYKNCFNAVVQVLAKNDMTKVRQWGRLYGEAIVTGVYKGIIKEGAPLDSLKKYGTYIKSVFDFGEIVIEPVSESEAVVVVSGFDPDFEAHYHIMMGWIERSLELCGARDIQSSFTSMSWQGDPDTRIRMAWTM